MALEEIFPPLAITSYYELLHYFCGRNVVENAHYVMEMKLVKAVRNLSACKL